VRFKRAAGDAGVGRRGHVTQALEPSVGQSTRVQPRSGSSGTATSLLLLPIFLALAAWFVFGPRAADVPITATADVAPEQVQGAPLRRPLGDPPLVLINSFERNCMDCHRVFPSFTGTQSRLRQHENIVLDHGMNDRCLNCHDNEDRDRLALHDGTTIGYGQVELLCAQCHGTTYRDWQRNGHGKVTGYWAERYGPMRRLTCTECHDPHAPAFEPFVPLPGPHTLRMGDPAGHVAPPTVAERDSPLRKASRWKPRMTAPEDEEH